MSRRVSYSQSHREMAKKDGCRLVTLQLTGVGGKGGILIQGPISTDGACRLLRAWNRLETQEGREVMPRVHHVKKARKPIKEIGVKKGDEYFWWKTRRPGAKAGVMRRSKTRPRPSQLTASEFLSACYAAQEAFDDEPKGTKEEAADACRCAAEAIRERGQECDDKYNNMSERWPNGCPTMELLEQRRDACETLADELESAADEIDGIDEEELVDGETVEDLIASALDGVGWTFE